jgi:DUF2889 family protein
MALSAPVPRKHLHTRRYEFCGYEREDGLWDIEGRITDTKTYGFANEFRGEIQPGEPIHDMRVRLTLDDDLTVADIEVTTDAGPYRICPDIAPNFLVMKGERIKPGWHMRIKELLGGVKGCTHISEMLGSMGTVAYQTMYWRRKPSSGEKSPPPINSCHAFAADGEVVKHFYPQFYRGK